MKFSIKKRGYVSASIAFLSSCASNYHVQNMYRGTNLIKNAQRAYLLNYTRYLPVNRWAYYNTSEYVHGMSREQEEIRLRNQSKGAEKFLWNNIDFRKLLGDKVDKPFLEVGCGVGAQTLHLLHRLPSKLNVIGVDIDPDQIVRAQKNLLKFEQFKSRVTFEVSDVRTANWEANAFSGAYISWVLEHIGNKEAEKLLLNLRHSIQDGGVIIANEIIMEPQVGMNIVDAKGNFPSMARRFLEAMIAYQHNLGGNPNYGTEENMKRAFSNAGFTNFTFRKIAMVYPKEALDNSKKAAIEMFDGVVEKLIANNLFSAKDYTKVLSEINDASDLSWTFGQVIACKN